MTVSSETYKNVYNGDGSTTAFSFSFPILDESHLDVFIKNAAGTVTLQVIDTDYTVSGTGNEPAETNYTSGTITFITAPLDTDVIAIARDVPVTQETDYTENGTFPAESHEDALDKLTMLIQQQFEIRDRSLKFDIATSTSFDTTLPTPTVNGILAINATNDGITYASDSSAIGPLSKADGTFYVGDGTTVVAETGNTARTSLGLGTTDSPTFAGGTFSSAINLAATLQHTGDTTNNITFGVATQTYSTGGISRLDITNSGVRLGGANARVTTILDQDEMTGNSATALATQQSIKAYHDSGTATLTNKTIAAASNIISGLTIGAEVTGASTDLTDTTAITYNADTDVSGNSWVLDEDNMASNDATKVPTQQSVKAYADTKLAGVSSSTDNAIVRWDGTTGKLLQNSTVTITDAGSMTFPTNAGWIMDGGTSQSLFQSYVHSANVAAGPVTLTCASPGDLSVVYGSRSVTYTTLDSMVHVQVSLICTPTFTTASGQLRIGGLPETASTVESSCLTLAHQDSDFAGAWPTGATMLTGTVVVGQSYFIVRGHGNGVASVDMAITDLTSGNEIEFVFSGTYYIG